MSRLDLLVWIVCMTLLAVVVIGSHFIPMD